jgi:hypothetical protein
MADKSRTCKTESLHLAHWWEATRSAWLHHYGYHDEGLTADRWAKHYRQRMADELGVYAS